jgi:hypothetical protein
MRSLFVRKGTSVDRGFERKIVYLPPFAAFSIDCRRIRFEFAS